MEGSGTPREATLMLTAKRRWRRLWKKWRAFGTVNARLAPYWQSRWGAMTLALATSVAYASMRLLEPWPIKLIIDNVLLARPLPSFLPSSLASDEAPRLLLLYVLAAAIVLFALLRGLFYYRHRLFAARLGIEISADLRLDLYRHIQHLSLNFHDRRRTGDLLVRLTSDIRILRNAFVSLPLELTQSLLLMLGMGIVMALMDWQLTLVAMAMLPLVVILVRRYQRPMRRAIRKQREREGQLASMAAEALGAIQVVQGFRGEKHEVKRFGGANRRDMRSGLKASRYEAKLKWSADLTVSLITAVLVLLAARRILLDAMSVGDLIVFVSYLRIFARPLQRVSRITERMIRATSAGERVFNILDIESEVNDLPGAVSAPRLAGEISIQDVTFAYARSKPVLHEVNLTIRAGERVAIVGPTGVGKSTLVGLIPRFYDPLRGVVSIDGHDLRELTLASLRRQVALVFQEPILFATTIAENIAYGKPRADMAEIVKAARRAHVHEIIAGLEDGYETVLGERGGRLSGGQRQCVAIARAMLCKAPILILDEPTTGLDGKSAAMVTKALRRLVQDRTVVVITHDPRNLDIVDRVIRLEAGRVVEDSPSLRAAEALEGG